MNLKKGISLMMVTAMSMSVLFGCASKQGAGIAPAEETKKKEQKVIKVGMEVAYPPFEYYEEDQTTITGLDHDLAVAIGEELGYKIEFVDTPWDQIFTDLDQGKYDVVMSAITITPERSQKYDFSLPYIQNYQSLVTLHNAPVKPGYLHELKGMTVGCLEESTSASYLTDFLTKNSIVATVKPYPVMLDAFTDLKNGVINAVLCDSTLADQYCKDTTYEMTWKQGDSPEEFAVCFPKGSKLTIEFSNAIKKLQQNGKLEQILNTYLGQQ